MSPAGLGGSVEELLPRTWESEKLTCKPRPPKAQGSSVREEHGAQDTSAGGELCERAETGHDGQEFGLAEDPAQEETRQEPSPLLQSQAHTRHWDRTQHKSPGRV